MWFVCLIDGYDVGYDVAITGTFEFAVVADIIHYT